MTWRTSEFNLNSDQQACLNREQWRSGCQTATWAALTRYGQSREDAIDKILKLEDSPLPDVTKLQPHQVLIGVKILDEGIGTNGGDHRHVEDAPNLSASAPDATAAAQTAAVAVKRRQAGQCRNLFALECPQFGQVREQGGREYRAALRHGAEQLVTFAPDRGRTDQDGEFVGAAGERLCEPAEVLIDAFVDPLGRVSPAVLFRREHLHQLAAAVDAAPRAPGLVRPATRALGGLTAAPKRTSTWASSAAVWASGPVARAKSRTGRGLTTATPMPAVARALATATSRPPVAATITRSAGFQVVSATQ